MNSSVAPDFWQCYNRLPAQVQARARKQYELWRENHWHPSLHFKRVGPFWSVRIDDNHRALGIEADGTSSGSSSVAMTLTRPDSNHRY